MEFAIVGRQAAARERMATRESATASRVNSRALITSTCSAPRQTVHGGEAQSYIIDRYLEKYRDMTTSGQYRIAGIAMRIGYEKGIPMIGPALFQQLYLPTKAKT
jgi:hypothetical protein